MADERVREAKRVIEGVLNERGGEACVTSSFQAECVALVHMVTEQRPEIPVLFLDTGYHFAETYAYRDRMSERLHLNVVNLRPHLTVPEQEPEVDGHEIVALRWLTAAEAFAAFRAKEITLRLPTIKNLELLQAAGTRSAEILAALDGRAVPSIRPRVLQVDGKPLAVLPGDPRCY